MLTLNDILLSEYIQEKSQYDHGRTILKQLAQLVFKAMKNINHRHRSVLALWHYEKMSISQIAEVIGCTRIKAWFLIFIAQIILKQQLRHHGFSRHSFIKALDLFGRITDPQDTYYDKEISVF